MRKKRFKIAEQLIVVLIAAIIFPLAITGAIVTNVNQHAVRKELQFSSSLLAESIHNRINNIFDNTQQKLDYIKSSVKNIDSLSKQKHFLNDISKISDEIEKIEIITHLPSNLIDNSRLIYQNFDIEVYINIIQNKIILSRSLNSKYLVEYINIDKLKNLIFSTNNDKREIYIIDNKTKALILTQNGSNEKLDGIIEEMPENINTQTPIIFGKIKNQPNTVIKLDEPDLLIIVATPKNVTKYGITKSRNKIIVALLIAAFSTILLAAAYILSLYINIRQLFKAIKAIGMGNFSRKIRLIQNWLTPFETIFLAEEFNKMAEKIHSSYNELHDKNEKLKAMDEYKSNLIDTVSHELRTPLTGIKGYTSRLLRHDVQIDEETRIKSLKVIKQQAERLGRMVEDLLVIPDIESSTLRFVTDEVNIKEVIETAILSTNQKNSRLIIVKISESIPNIWADTDRVEQIIINLIDNAIKYSAEDSEIQINVSQNKDFGIIKIQNDCETIAEEKLKSLFSKFSRIDSEMTRTTRGTGLGLFIVKGLIEAMGGEIKLKSEDNIFEVSFTLPLQEPNEEFEVINEIQKELNE